MRPGRSSWRLIVPFLILNLEEYRFGIVIEQTYPIYIPHPDLIAVTAVGLLARRLPYQRGGKRGVNLLLGTLGQIFERDKDIMKELSLEVDSRRRRSTNSGGHYLALEGTEDDHAKLDY